MEIYTVKISLILVGVSTVLLLFFFLKVFLPERRRRSLMLATLRTLAWSYDLQSLLMLAEDWRTQSPPCRLSIHRFQQVQKRLRNGVVNSRLRNSVYVAPLVTNSVTVRKNVSNTFSLTAPSILGLTVGRENTVVLSRGLSALQDEKYWCSTLDQWMDGVGVRAHFAVKRLPYHLHISTWTNSPPSMGLKSDAVSKHSLTVRVRSPMLYPFAI